MKDFDDRIDDLLEGLRQGEMNADEVRELERLMQSDPALRKRYLDRIWMEEELKDTFGRTSDMILPFELERGSKRSPRALAWLGGIAAAIAALLAVAWMAKPSPPPTVATLESRSADTWDGPLALVGGSRVTPGEVRLDSGTARFRFDSGALVTLEGPAALVIETPMKARLLHGEALVEAPESAHGFVVALPHGEIVDLGTKFGVSVKQEAATCEVLDGRVLMRHQDGRQEEHLDDGEVMAMTPEGISRLDYQPSQSFPPEDRGRIVLRSSAEATVVKLRNSRHLPTGMRQEFVDDRMLLVKTEAGSMAQRRALINVDLRRLRGKAIGSARLNLNLVPSGLGFSAYLPDTITFAVYGITDERMENWPAGSLRWEDAPGYLADADVALDPEEVTMLGKFEIERGRQRGTCMIETDELREFLDNDTTGIAGFVLVRETYGTSNYSLVHAFASSHHPEASGPSLDVIPVTDK